MSTQDEWDGILAKDEKIIWQGRPSSEFKFQKRMLYHVFSVTVTILAAVIFLNAAPIDNENLNLFIFLALGINVFIALIGVIGPGYQRGRTWYTLTNKRGYIATALPMMGRKLRSYPIGPNTGIDFVQGNPPSIHFGTRAVKRDKRTVQEPDGFEYIADAPEVMRLIRDLQDSSNRIDAP